MTPRQNDLPGVGDRRNAAAARLPDREEVFMEFVLVHGTTQSPAGWERLAGLLRAGGRDVTAVDLPVNRPEWTVTEYAREAAAQAGEPAGRRVVVGHSGAGVLLPAIADAARAAAIVWLAAYIPDFAGGHSMAEDVQAHRDAMFHPDWLGVDPTSDPQQAMRFLFHDCDPATAQWALGTLRLFNPGPAVYRHTPAPLSPDAERSVIVPAGDRTLRPEWMRQAARERLGIQPAEVSAGHCPHVSQPEAVARILCQA
jgi:pimeloyl-ACP methyl ester carboxylesterase